LWQFDSRDDIAQSQAPTGHEDPRSLSENALFVRDQIDDPVRNHAIDAVIFYGQGFDVSGLELHSAKASPGSVTQTLGLATLGAGHVDPNHAPRRSHVSGGHEGVHTTATAKIENTLARAQVGESKVMAHACERVDSSLWHQF
jgi:hypothetical protein